MKKKKAYKPPDPNLAALETHSARWIPEFCIPKGFNIPDAVEGIHYHRFPEPDQRHCYQISDLVIEVATRRDGSRHAQFKDHPELWGCGKTIDAAVGNLLLGLKAREHARVKIKMIEGETR
jgi:hypothetical protein